MRGFTGAVADGWFPWLHAPEPYEADLRHVLEVAERRGRDASEIDRAVLAPTTVYEDRAAARDAATERNRTSLALRPPLLAKLGDEDLAAESPIMFEMLFDEERERQLVGAADAIPDEAVEQITIAGTAEEAIDDIESFVAAGVDTLVVIPVGDVEETLGQYEDHIMPYVKDQ